MKRNKENLSVDTFLSILDGLNVQLMVTEFETDKILFSNKKMNDDYNLPYNPVGRRCWETYQEGKSGRCAFCPLTELERNYEKPVVWESFNTATGKWFRNTNIVIPWTDGKLVHLQQGADITESKNIADTLRQRLQQQELLNTISQIFIASEDVDVLLPKALKLIGDFLAVDKVTIIPAQEEPFIQENFFTCYIESKIKKIKKAKLVVDKSDINELFVDKQLKYVTDQTHPACRCVAEFTKKGMTAFLLTPVFVDGKLWGAMNFEMWSGQRQWTEHEEYFAMMVSNMIGGVISRYKIQRAIKDAEKRTQAMFDMTPLACTFFDDNYNVVACNEEAPRMYGLKSKQEYLDRFFYLSPPNQPDGANSNEKAFALLQKAFQTGREVFEWLHMHADGSPMPIETSLIKVKWRDGYRIAGYARDLRELKATMAQIEQTQVELRRERDRAEESAKAKTNFLANMSHEIRTPLNAITGMTEIAKSTDEAERLQYCLGRIDDAASHLLGIINDILDISKIEAGKFELSPADFLLEKMLARVNNVINFRAEQKSQDLRIKIGKGVPPAIITDQQRLAQVVTNLLANAVKFTPEHGKIRLYIKKVAEHGDTCSLLFQVTDTGIGISGEQQRRLFQNFEQADGSISRRFGGTGLGLAICKSIVEMMGGSIGVDSQPEQGSRFYFTIKVKKGTASYQSRLNPKINWKNVRILVVDDAPEVREYFADIAAAAGIFCKSAPDGYQACRLLAEDSNYHILFVDWLMPGMNGLELTKKIRQNFPDSIIVSMVSSAEHEQSREQALSAGVDKFISKPLLPSLIIDCINECLGEQAKQNKSLLEQSNTAIFAGKKILLAEDIEINREILCALLEETKVEIDCAENGKEAVAQFAQAPRAYDLILMDIHMPEMDGYQATQQIRSLPVAQAADIPIIAMTANVFKEDVARCLAAGMNDHIGKPVDHEELMSKLKNYLS